MLYFAYHYYVQVLIRLISVQDVHSFSYIWYATKKTFFFPIFSLLRIPYVRETIYRKCNRNNEYVVSSRDVMNRIGRSPWHNSWHKERKRERTQEKTKKDKRGTGERVLGVGAGRVWSD